MTSLLWTILETCFKASTVISDADKEPDTETEVVGPSRGSLEDIPSLNFIVVEDRMPKPSNHNNFKHGPSGASSHPNTVANSPVRSVIASPQSMPLPPRKPKQAPRKFTWSRDHLLNSFSTGNTFLAHHTTLSPIGIDHDWWPEMVDRKLVPSNDDLDVEAKTSCALAGYRDDTQKQGPLAKFQTFQVLLNMGQRQGSVDDDDVYDRDSVHCSF